jgi:hypothetical protein
MLEDMDEMQVKKKGKQAAADSGREGIKKKIASSS